MTVKESNYRLNRFNHFINLENMSKPHGYTITIEELEALAIRASIYAILGEFEPNKDEQINILELVNLAEELEAQGLKSLENMNQSFHNIEEV